MRTLKQNKWNNKNRPFKTKVFAGVQGVVFSKKNPLEIVKGTRRGRFVGWAG
jgi:hypothetical protein